MSLPSPAPSPAHGCVLCVCARTHICPPPWSPCGFKVLILIRFQLTYCQSSFSCSSETLGSYQQGLDLGYKPPGRLVPTSRPWNTDERLLASLARQAVSWSVRRSPTERTLWPRFAGAQVPPRGSVGSGSAWREGGLRAEPHLELCPLPTPSLTLPGALEQR